jgi:hypothetical protein
MGPQCATGEAGHCKNAPAANLVILLPRQLGQSYSAMAANNIGNGEAWRRDQKEAPRPFASPQEIPSGKPKINRWKLCAYAGLTQRFLQDRLQKER